MDELLWLADRDPERMLLHLRRSARVSERRLRLWACACLRRLWVLIPEKESRNAVAVAEGYADGRVDEEALLRARRAAPEVDHEGRISYAHGAAIQTTHYEGPRPEPTGRHVDAYRVGGAYAAAVVASFYAARGVFTTHAALLDGNAARERERAAQADLLRHIVGNPWKPLVSPAHWPTTVNKLAEALYEGEDCSAALHDALLEGGHNDFAQHFRESYHPKGCAWLDAILGKS